MELSEVGTVVPLLVTFVVGVPGLVLLFFQIRKCVRSRRAQETAVVPDVETSNLEITSPTAASSDEPSPPNPSNGNVINHNIFNFYTGHHPDIPITLAVIHPRRVLRGGIERDPVTSLQGLLPPWRVGTWPSDALRR
ncbi:uncharacterized protein H6S33_008473 [Morchella sextelata]|uniref:uncharacterized protein n=1 Tax=Morchella sextelata TaxID=1174677 RepID=UPI001D052181|nr:uncharacterized protein H6S33_008473 [Morchella sextelata]KAH0602823.1 hypothetical protein H6S33_008473 [Morchella sextelata]